MRDVTDQPITERSDEELAAEAAREGSDGPAFSALVERFQDRVWRVCYRLMGNAEDAHDAAQEVFVRLFLQRTRFEGRSRYSTWVHGIALRTCLMLRRSRGRRRRYEMLAADESRAQNSPQLQADATLDVNQILEQLDDEDRALLILKYAEGHSHDELAEMFELSVSACKMRIARARERLQQRFPEHSFGGEDSESRL
jgi:RNA polymerase sigma-70 factor (ECF subfamily)